MAQTFDQTSARPSYLRLGLRILLALAFGGAGLAKLAGLEMQVTVFETMGFGMWLMWVTAILEVGAAILLLIPATAFVGALLAAGIGAGAAASQILFIGDSWIPAATLCALACLAAWLERPGR